MARSYIVLVIVCIVAGLCPRPATPSGADRPGATKVSIPLSFDPVGRELPVAWSQLDARIRELERAAVREPRDPLVRAELAVAYRQSGTIEGRKRSVARLREAMDRARCGKKPRRAATDAFCGECYLALGLTRRAQGFESYAKDELRRAIQFDSTRAEAHLELGLTLFEGWRELRISDATALDESRRSLARALSLDPTSDRAVLPLAVLEHVKRDTVAARATLDLVRTHAPDAASTQLVEGLVTMDLGDDGSAGSAFDRAIAGLAGSDPPFADAMCDIRPLLSFDEGEAYGELDPADRAEWERRYWQANDPTPTTDGNERRVEHCARVLLADVLFAVPSLRLRGWDTERGRTYIRYGPPNAQFSDPGDVYPGAMGGFVPPSQVWSYRFPETAFALKFEDRGLHGNYTLPHELSGRGGWIEQTYLIENAYPGITRWQYPGRELPVIAEVCRFPAKTGGLDVVVFFELPSPDIPWRKEESGCVFNADKRIAVFDHSWNEVVRRNEEVVYRGGATLEDARAALFVDALQADVPEGDFHLTFEIESDPKDARALWKQDVEMRPLGDGPLLVSDLVFARRVRPSSAPWHLARSGLYIVPRPGHQFLRGESITFYYELNGLALTPAGTTRYEVSYTIDALDDHRGSGLGRGLRRLFGGAPPRNRSVLYRFERAGQSGRAGEHLTLEPTALVAGRYRLTVEVRDIEGGGTASRTGEFEVVQTASSIPMDEPRETR